MGPVSRCHPGIGLAVTLDPARHHGDHGNGIARGAFELSGPCRHAVCSIDDPLKILPRQREGALEGRILQVEGVDLPGGVPVVEGEDRVPVVFRAVEGVQDICGVHNIPNISDLNSTIATAIKINPQIYHI